MRRWIIQLQPESSWYMLTSWRRCPMARLMKGWHALADIEQQQCTLRVACRCDAFGIEQGGVVEANQAHRDKTRVSGHGRNEIIRPEEAIAWRNDFHF